jgi:hypothetical protein
MNFRSHRLGPSAAASQHPQVLRRDDHRGVREGRVRDQGVVLRPSAARQRPEKSSGARYRGGAQEPRQRRPLPREQGRLSSPLPVSKVSQSLRNSTSYSLL